MNSEIGNLVQESQTPQWMKYQQLIFTSMGLFLVIAVIVLSFYVTQMSDPYVREVLSLKGDRSQGEAIFQINCAGCHGIQGNGNVGPSLHNVTRRKSKMSLIHQVISGQTPPMPKFQPNTQEMADLLSYLQKI